jgi:cell division septal protein FtsQ
MWYEEDSKRSRRSRFNRRREDVHSILMVSARLSEQRRERMHRAGGLALLAVTLAGALGAFMLSARFLGQKLFSKNEAFTIRHLDITSDGRLQPGLAREYAHVREGMNLFGVDLQEIREELESVPAVSSVRVSRRLPDTLVIDISERVAVARLGAGAGGYPLAIDRDGYVLGPMSASPRLPAVVGAREKGLRPGARVGDPGILFALEVLDQCEEPELRRFIKISHIDAGNPDYLDVELVRGERVRLSRTNVRAKLARLCEIMKTSADSGQAIARVDLTVEKNFPVIPASAVDGAP